MNLRIDLNPALIASVLIESGIGKESGAKVKAMDVSIVNAHASEDVITQYVKNQGASKVNIQPRLF